MNLLQNAKNFIKPIYNNIFYFLWVLKGCPSPPPHIAKRKYLLSISKKYSLKIFVETGTFKGDMINALKNNFTQLYSIEVSNFLYVEAKKRFSKYNKIRIIEGDSAIRLKELMNIINCSTLFWLDAHCSEGITSQGEKYTPILEEIKIILETNLNHVIVIDDLRLFDSDINYPTYIEVENIVKNVNSNYLVFKKFDFIIIQPNIL